MKRLLLFFIWLLWLLVPALAHAQVYDTAAGVSGDCKPVITGTANGVSVWTEFGPDTAPCFYVDASQGQVNQGIQTSTGAGSRYLVNRSGVTLLGANVTNSAFIHSIGAASTLLDMSNPAYKGAIVHLTDSAGKTAYGYVGAQGTGETLSGELLTSFTNKTSYAYETFTISGVSVTPAINTVGYGIAYGSLAGPIGKLYKYSSDLKVNSGVTPSIGFGDGGANFVRSAQSSVSTYATGPLTATQFILLTATGDLANFNLTNVHFNQVLTPPTTGCSIYSTATLTTNSWTNVDSGFNWNSTTFTVKIYNPDTYINKSGVLSTQAPNLPRVEFPAGVPMVLQESGATNFFLNSEVPATHTTKLGVGSYVLWMDGTGNVEVSSGGGATGTGFGVASGTSKICFSISIAGNVTSSVTGSVTRAQIENGSNRSSFIPTSGTTLQRASDSGVTYALPVSPVGGSMFAESLGGGCVNDGGFDTACGAGTWTCEASWEISGTSAQFKDTGGNKLNEALSTSIKNGKLYKISFDIVTSGINTAYFVLGKVDLTQLFDSWDTYKIYSTGTYIEYHRAIVDSTTLQLRGSTTGTTFTLDNLSIKEVPNSFADTVSTPLPPHGTAMIDFRPGYNASDMTSVTQAVLDLSGDTLFQVYASGVTCYDGTTGATVAYTPVMDKTARFIAEWGYLVNNVAKMKVGIIQDNQPVSWGIEQNYDGSFSTGSQIRVLTSPWGRAHAGQPRIHPRIVSDAELNMMGSP